MSFEYNIVFGDYWDDGHGLTETYRIRCNYSPTELVKLEVLSEFLTGYRFQTNPEKGIEYKMKRGLFNEYDRPYEDQTFDAVMDMILNHGLDNSHPEGQLFRFPADGIDVEDLDLDRYWDYNVGFRKGIEDMAELFMRWLKIGTPDLKWEFLPKTKETQAIFNCRGYGFFLI